MISRLITHNGGFHADDLFAYVVLATLYPDAELERTRDPQVIETADPGTTLIFDVGGVYDAKARRYDHHQPGRPVRKNGIPYSSFGLIWRDFGPRYLSKILSETEDVLEKTWSWLDHSLVQTIDALDNGAIKDPHHPALHTLSLSSLLAAFEPDPMSDGAEVETEAFRRAAHVAAEILQAKARTLAIHVRDEAFVREVIARRKDSDWIELPRSVSFMAQMMEEGAEGIHYVVSPKGEEWHLKAVSTTPQGFELRKPLPGAWAGLRNEELAAVTGIKDAVFCHLDRFIAVARSRDGIMSLLDQARAERPDTGHRDRSET